MLYLVWIFANFFPLVARRPEGNLGFVYWIAQAGFVLSLLRHINNSSQDPLYSTRAGTASSAAGFIAQLIMFLTMIGPEAQLYSIIGFGAIVLVLIHTVICTIGVWDPDSLK